MTVGHETRDQGPVTVGQNYGFRSGCVPGWLDPTPWLTSRVVGSVYTTVGEIVVSGVDLGKAGGIQHLARVVGFSNLAHIEGSGIRLHTGSKIVVSGVDVCQRGGIQHPGTRSGW